MRLFVLRFMAGHARTFGALAFGVASYAVIGVHLAPPIRTVVAWDCGAAFFLVSASILFYRALPAAMPGNAERQQEGEWTIFWIMIGSVAFSFTAIMNALAGASHLPSAEVRVRIGLVAITLLLSWLLTQIVFAMRYAHEYYERVPGGALKKGLMFPGEDEPDYWDFVYFAIVLGMTFQVSDVQIGTRGFRRLATVHGFLGFLFNTVIIALTVNAAAALV